MKTLQFLASEYSEQIDQINKKTRPFIICAILTSIVFAAVVLWLYIYKQSSREFLNGDVIYLIVGAPLFIQNNTSPLAVGYI